MAITVRTPNPHLLLWSIRQSIAEGKIRTWSVDTDGDFTHCVDQWANAAWLRPRIADNLLVFNTIAPQGIRMSTPVYGIYHGRFAEMLLSHFDSHFLEVTCSALPQAPDRV